MNLQQHDLYGRLVDIVRALMGSCAIIPDPFPVDRRLSDLGISSVNMVKLMLAVEVEFDIAIPQTDVTAENFHCLASIESLVERTLRMRRTG